MTHARTQRIILPGIRWCTYEDLRTDLGDSHAALLAYNQGTLEIMAPSFSHEQLNRTLAALVEAIAIGLRRDFVNAGSTTFTRPESRHGFEPDSCFYIQQAAVVRGHTTIDLATDPPPDLVIEVDITPPSLDKLPICAAMGVPEVWRHDGQQVVIHRLRDGTYDEVSTSDALAGITAQQIDQFVEASQTMTRPDWFAAVQDHVQRLGA
jgi:Uma2 family endonuclease